MLGDTLRTAAAKLFDFHGRFANLFGRSEARKHSLVYLRGLLLCEGRKSVERIALRFAEPPEGEEVSQAEVLALQGFLTESPWEYQDVQEEIQKVFAEELVPSAADSPVGVVGVIDESAFVKSGPHSVGVKRQYCGRLGKKENCQVGVFLVGSTPAGEALLDHQLYLPKEWASDRRRRKRTHVPKEIRFQTKPKMAGESVRRTEERGHVKFDWIVADELYGNNGDFLDSMETQNKRYMVEVSCTTKFWTVDPATQVPPSTGMGRHPTRPSHRHLHSARDLAAALPADAWRAIRLREGEKGPLVFEYARLRVWSRRHGKPGPEVWLVFQRSVDNPNEIKYWISNADKSTSLDTLALVGSTRFRVELFLEEAKGELGMSHYEARAWSSWHHHMTLVSLAHLYATLVRRDARTAEPRLTLRMSFDLLRSALEQPTLTFEQALHLADYHIERNETAHESHRKTWLAKHKRLTTKLLL